MATIAGMGFMKALSLRKIPMPNQCAAANPAWRQGLQSTRLVRRSLSLVAWLAAPTHWIILKTELPKDGAATGIMKFEMAAFEKDKRGWLIGVRYDK
jgi:hypothetical protein